MRKIDKLKRAQSRLQRALERANLVMSDLYEARSLCDPGVEAKAWDHIPSAQDGLENVKRNISKCVSYLDDCIMKCPEVGEKNEQDEADERGSKPQE